MLSAPSQATINCSHSWRRFLRECSSGWLSAMGSGGSATNNKDDHEFAVAAPEATPTPAAVADSWDYKGRAANKSNTGGWIAAALILGVELCERLTTLGIAVNLVTYLVGTMHLSNAHAANIVTNFMGTSFILCLLGGFLADTFLGRYLTILIFAILQAIGVTLLAVSTVAPNLRPEPCDKGRCPRADGLQMGVLLGALFTVAAGTGGLKSSVSGFGSDQFDEAEPKERAQMTRFFNWFFFLISIGSLMAVTVLVYIQDNVGRAWGYGVCAACIATAVAVFLSGTRLYRYKRRAGSPLTQIAQVLVAACRNRALPVPADPALLYEQDPVLPPRRRLLRSGQFAFLDRAAVPAETDPPGGPLKPNPWRLQPVTKVEEVKMVARMLPIWATTIMFWTIYAQVTTFSVEQATSMDTRVGHSFRIPPASLTVFFVGSILLTVPLYDRVVVPATRRCTGHPQGLTTLRRIGVGLVLSVLAMVSAALVEIRRLRAAHRHGVVGKGAVVPISVFWLVPQFFFVGAGEAFTYIGQLDFFIRESPAGMKSMSTGLFLSTLALGFFVSSLLVSAVHGITSPPGWLADDLNRGRLYNFYWLLAVLSVLNFLAYLLCAKWYVYKDSRLTVHHDDIKVSDTA